ncbi:hypothetical protein SERLA73DRAFT_150197 [Serpula lacrymans var. lacrymans S7.3]|uniref:Uncharacterized protein n=2 Tax=Serpula lacrymans var. lacrymans TaxID=341189 RepID=F8PLG5_SERL3|nr:uncharacterized protein SERLADRAFT_405830 [Serpula lacrymans var. lacrymans S7.9]EGO02447.1 hypothetical protein SERLA73DRAFT_150197 [Serpula lacrymans var. lacrymans S7.3]EGO28177.1 hypothetical protein SERLADRAFT_405830 [Serpula lacrymans var. lacrymans S7.9]
MSTQPPATRFHTRAPDSHGEKVTSVAEVLANVHLDYADMKTKEKLATTKDNVRIIRDNVANLGQGMGNTKEDLHSIKDTLGAIKGSVDRIHVLCLRSITNELTTMNKMHTMEMFMMKLNANFWLNYGLSDVPVTPVRSSIELVHYPSSFCHVEEFDMDTVHDQLAAVSSSAPDSHHNRHGGPGHLSLQLTF